jgi:MFS family permease
MAHIAVIDNAQQDVERNFRWNFVVNALDGASFWFGMSFISFTVIMPLFASHFTKNALLIGLIPFITNAGVFLPQLFMANTVERAPVKKFFPVVLGFFLERVPIFLLVPLAAFLANRQPAAGLGGFFFLLIWHAFGVGITIVGWQDMIAKIIPVDQRGRFYGITNFIGNGTGILGALAVPVVLERFAFPTGYVLSFAAASMMIFLSWVFLSLSREPAVKSNKPRVSELQYFRSLPFLLREDRNFRMYLLAQVVFSLSGMAIGFLVVHTVQTWNLSDEFASRYTIAMQVGIALANLFFGFFSDRKGHKLSLEICFLMSTISLVLAVAASSPWWFFIVLFLRGAVGGSFFISGISIVYEFTNAENRPTYIGLANTVPGIAGTFAPLVGGWLAGATSYRAMFLVAAVIAALSWMLLHFTVQEPRTSKPEPQ